MNDLLVINVVNSEMNKMQKHRYRWSIWMIKIYEQFE